MASKIAVNTLFFVGTMMINPKTLANCAIETAKTSVARFPE